MLKINSDISRKIRNMSIVCALLVVTIHVDWCENANPILWWAKELICQGVARIAVPFFFVISGFFVAAHVEDSGWWGQEVRKRVKTLLIPFFFWSVVSLVATAPLSIIADHLANRPFGSSIPLFNGKMLNFLGVNIFAYPTHGPLWYVRCLFLFVLVAPIFKFLVYRLGVAWLMLSFAFVFFNSYAYALCPNFNPDAKWLLLFDRGISNFGIFYFSLGFYLRKHIAVFQRVTDGGFQWGALIIGSILVLLRAYLCYINSPMANFCGIISIPILMYGVFKIMPTVQWPVLLVTASFPIYVMHRIFQSYLGVFFKHAPFLSYWIIPFAYFIIGVTMPVLVAAISRKYFPKTAELMFGGR